VHFSDAERDAIAAIWGKIHIDEIGPQSLARVLIVYPWTQRYFSKFGDMSSVAAISGNPKVAAHGKVVLGALEKGVKNLDNVKATYSNLSQLHCEKLNVDPDNFRALGDCITIVVASKFGNAFTPELQNAWHKFLSVVAAALSSRYF
uniref:Hemoglobin cathodic subunit beta n=1 Tax=Hoplosternum littorale TaxID=114109 RepID=HBBC_HOPLI|nr:RecName: Full=Hemoglobin cathodic subunit beta; AltName: Full=Hemoglobin cathodic beta chain; Short=Hb(Ca) beta chain [Hoplosternum littorale]